MMTQYPEVPFTELTSDNVNLTKSYSLKHGGLIKRESGVLSKGTAQRKNLSLDKIDDYLNGLNQNQAICHGDFGSNSAQITTKRRADGVNNIARSTEYFSYPEQQSALVLFDHDRDPHSPTFDSPHEIVELLTEIMPAISEAAWVSRPSASAGIIDSEGNELTESSGSHFYMVVEDGSDIPRFIKDLKIHLVLNGYGYPYLNVAGGVSIRTIIDDSVASPERIDYSAPAVLGEGLSRKERRTFCSPGGMLDTKKLPPPTKKENRKYKVICNEIISSVSNESEKVRNNYVKKRAEETGSTESEIQRQLEIADQGCLAPDHQLTTDKGGTITVSTILDAPSKWNGVTIRDPIEPDKGSNKAKIFVNENGSIIVHSFIHGERNFTLRESTPEAQLTQTLEWVVSAPQDEVMKNWPERITHHSRAERNQIMEQILKRAPIGIRKKDLKDELKAYQSDQKALAISIEIEKNNTTRIKWLPDQLDTIVIEVINILSQEEDENTLYNHSGSLVQLKMGTSTPMGAVSTETVQPLLFPMTNAVLAARLLETLTFVVHTERGPKSIPSPQEIVRYLIDAPFGLKYLQAIQSWPTITPKGHLLHLQGYDTETKLYVSFDHGLLDYYKKGAGRDDAIVSIKWLQEVLLAEFPFESEHDRDGVIAALLTAVMIRVQPIAPGFLFLAPIQASGKTTLIEIIFRSVFGIPAAASRWHDREEEMAKFILSMLREGYPGIVFDNIKANSTIDSAEVAKLITGEEYQNRILGVSQTARLPANVLVTASGNQISVAGDLVSRMLPIKLVPDIEDPSKRKFSRRDIVGWTDKHRSETLSHLLTILSAYFKAGSEIDTLIPTRLPAWDRTVRSAMIWSGCKDPNNLFDRNKSEDLEGQATSTLISSLHDYFKDKLFTTKDLTRVMQMSREQPTPEVIKTQSIFESITELLDGEQPTSRSISKIIRSIDGRVAGNLQLVKSTNKGSGGVLKYRVTAIGKEVLVA